MESWKQGRGELLEQLENVCNQIGHNIAAELKNDKFARISHEELRILRETSASVQKLAESHGRLTDELEICRGAAAKVEELEKENKRLAQELQAKLKQDVTPLAKPGTRVYYGNILDLTPGSSEPPSSVARIEPGEPIQAVQKKYDDLTKKYNKVCQKLDAMKGAKDYAERLAKEEKSKSRKWSEWGKGMSEKVDKRDERIRKLKEEIDELKSKLIGHSDEIEQEYATNQQSDIMQALGRVPRPVEAVTGEEVQVQVPASNPPKSHQQGTATNTSELEQMATMGNSEADEGHGHPKGKEMDLPPMLDTKIGDTSFEPLEAHQTSSTEGESDSVLPEKMIGDDVFADGKLEDEQPSSPAVFVSSRSVRKRKVRHQNADETPDPKIKTEFIELSSPHTPIPVYINTNESMDLDDIGEKVSTPRKVQKAAALSRLTATSQMSGQNRSQSQSRGNSSKISTPAPARQENSVLQPRSINTNILPRTSGDTRMPKKRRIASDREVAALFEDGELDTGRQGLRRQTSNSNERLIELLSKPSPERRVLSPQQTRSTVQTHILSALRPELPTPRETSVSTPATARELLEVTSRENPDAPKLNMEKRKAGREPTPNSKPSSTRNSREPIDRTAPLAKQIGQAPLESSRPSSDQVPRSSAESFRPSAKASSRSSNEPSVSEVGPSGRSPSPLLGTQLPARRDLASAFKSSSVQELAKTSPRTPTVGRPGKPNRTGTAKRKQMQTEANYEMDPSQEPLRSRPMSKLSLSDFKINPNYNQGYDYAYNDVVRGKEARACLEGCIKPGCCGYKFRGLAKAELDIRRLTLSQEERDKALMEDYLGGGADQLKYMSTAEKEEILVQAKTREIANKNGRHRHAYHRQSSPSGYWRTDFPTTQEDMEDRAKTKQQDREEVEQRYRHAMRPGGAWLFRDE
ncbi:DNA repair protein endonuclease SAE2/CtIP C-terminus-domain-containing protein [Cadophora sp. MPI-SDFR-AT-0126]|nr:DNA repair protein endonuclease SAE2/CtIP C-terminus-domain-containing protein [Leotiomycetes sp. MPI-SDFR-AT-0126]